MRLRRHRVVHKGSLQTVRLDDLELGTLNVLECLEVLKVLRTDLADHGDMRVKELSDRVDVAAKARTRFTDIDLTVVRQLHVDVAHQTGDSVDAARGGVDLVLFGEYLRNEVLHARLAVASRHTDDFELFSRHQLLLRLSLIRHEKKVLDPFGADISQEKR